MTPLGRLALIKTFDKNEIVRAMNFAIIPALIGPVLGPLVGGYIIRLNISRYLRTLTILNSNSVNLMQAIKISNSVLTNGYIKKQLLNSAKLVSEGASLSSSLAVTSTILL